MKRGEEISRPVEHTLSSTLVHRVFSPFMKQKSWKGGRKQKKVERRGGGGKTHFKTEHACKSLLRKRKREGSVE